MIRRRKKRAWWRSPLFLSLGLLGLLSCILIININESRNLYRQTQVLMGTFVEVISPDKRAPAIVFEEIKRIEELLSKYKPDSEVSKLNKLSKLCVSSDTIYLLREAKNFWLMSEGKFDITVGVLMDLWGFSDKKYNQPKEAEIKSALRLVGTEKIIFHDLDNMVELTNSGMKIDLGAIAKGYAVDCAVARLKESGIRSCLINAGGDIYALGSKFGKPWQVAIQDPREDSWQDILALKNQAVATSGDYEQFFLKENKRYSHILDPKTGYPQDSGAISVTVVASDCTTADALATSIFVLGKGKGLNLIKSFPGVKIKVIEEKDII